jgi:hypothetical protein
LSDPGFLYVSYLAKNTPQGNKSLKTFIYEMQILSTKRWYLPEGKESPRRESLLVNDFDIIYNNEDNK